MDRVHVAFVLEAALARVIVEALENPEAAALQAALALAHELQLGWRRSWTVELTPERRARLLAALAGEAELIAVVAGAPVLVRAASLASVEQHAGRLARLRELAAPAVVLAGTRGVVAAALATLEPSSPLDEEPEPLQLAGDGSPDLHAWSDRVLRWARGPHSGVTVTALAARDDDGADLALAPGSENTTLGMQPSRAFWLPPEIVLPHVPAPGVACGLGGGPASFGFEGDATDARVAAALQARMAALTSAQALLSFVWVPNDVEPAWDELW